MIIEVCYEPTAVVSSERRGSAGGSGNLGLCTAVFGPKLNFPVLLHTLILEQLMRKDWLEGGVVSESFGPAPGKKPDVGHPVMTSWGVI
ncbi:MAG: hypothetical protein QOH31_5293 [Verrucomicrobiota bacterium]